MKKAGPYVLIALTVAFLAFLMGMMVGRSSNQNHVSIQPLQTVSPAVKETEKAVPKDGDTHLININTASPALLDTLPGIGPVLAQRIYDYRMENGDFKDISQLMEVEGIGTEKLMAIYDLVTVED